MLSRSYKEHLNVIVAWLVEWSIVYTSLWNDINCISTQIVFAKYKLFALRGSFPNLKWFCIIKAFIGYWHHFLKVFIFQIVVIEAKDFREVFRVTIHPLKWIIIFFLFFKTKICSQFTSNYRINIVVINCSF